MNTKHLFLFLALVILSSCEKKECMEVVPTQQIVLIGDDYNVENCNDSSGLCLPMADLDDLSFQIVTDFGQCIVEAFCNTVVAIPCDDCGDRSAQEIFNLFWGNYSYWDATTTEGGNLRIAFADDKFPGAAVGDKIYIVHSTVSAYNGWWDIINVDRGIFSPGVLSLDLDLPYVSSALGDAYVLSTPMFFTEYASIPGGSFEQITSGSAFPGSNYLWTTKDAQLTDIPYDDGDCFRLCLYRIQINFDIALNTPFTFNNGECLGATNCFTKVTDLCYTTKIKYQFEENSMGFYGSNPVLTVRLPLYLSRPQYPGEEKGYQLSEGVFLKLFERMNKEWILKTAWIPDALHQRIRVALSADFIQLWNQNENLALEGVYRDAEYKIGWPEDVDYPTAPATTTIKKRVLSNSLNSNCG